MKTRHTNLDAGSGTPEISGPITGRSRGLTLALRTLLAAVFVLSAFRVQAGVSLTTLHTFSTYPNGMFPQAGLAQGSDGSFYGTTEEGGTNNAGTVFKISAAGTLTSLYSFTGGNDGAVPAGLVQGSDGNFYGTTGGGGTNNGGTVFKISPTGELTSLHSFTGTAFPYRGDGAQPGAGLVLGSDGNFYGTTQYGGTNGHGTVFEISAAGTLTSLYSFTGGIDGEEPMAGLVQGSDGNFYGTTSSGGAGYGTVFKISATGTFTSLYAFGGASDGAGPFAGLVPGNDGNFYGTTYYGGFGGQRGFYGYGTVFKISATGAFTSLYSFTGGNDGANPDAGLVQGSDGNFFGTTVVGGTNGEGTVFKISATGAFASLYSFTHGNDGRNPVAGLLQGSDGSFYGTAQDGGIVNSSNPYGAGTVFKISATGAFTRLYAFVANNDGADPVAGLVQGSDGNLYGTTYNGGTNGYGTVFKISAAGEFASLHSFNGASDGAYPNAGLVQGTDGNFYGTTFSGGKNYQGTIFKISSNGILASLYSFTGSTDGRSPYAGLVQGTDGNFYGTTSSGGTNGYGTLFKISAVGAFNSMYSFTGGIDGAYPMAGLAQGSDGNFYGATYGGTNNYGTVFKISATGAFANLYSFTGGNDGAWPVAALVQGSDANFYGTTDYGGIGLGYNGYGTVFKISATGAFTSLHSFKGNDGAHPEAGLIQGGDGNFYGTTAYGGPMGWGNLFKINANGSLVSLYSFTGGNDGRFPHAGLAQGSDANFYGTTYNGGSDQGTVFRLKLNQPPVSRIGGPYTAECHGAATTVQLDGSASSDPDDDALTFHWSSDCPNVTFSDAASPTPVLTIDSSAAQACTLTLAVSDGEFTNSSQTTVSVVDSHPPKFSHVSATPSTLWPPDNKMVLVTVSAQVTDTCDRVPVYRIVEVFSNDHDREHGRSKQSDFLITGDHTVLLRAERSDGREPLTYRLLLQGKDASGNTAVKSINVTVEEDHKRKDEPHQR